MKAACALVLCVACGPAPAPDAPLRNVPTAHRTDDVRAAVVGEHVTLRVGGVPIYGSRGGAPLSLASPNDTTSWVYTAPVLEVAPDAIRIRLDYVDQELWVWIDAATAYPVVRVTQPLARTDAAPVATDAGVWLKAGVPVDVRGPLGAPWVAIGYPPPDTERGDDFSVAFSGFVARGSIGRSFAPDGVNPRLPPWSKPLVDGGIAAEVRHEAIILDRPDGTTIATLTPQPSYSVTVLEIRGDHRRIALDTDELGVIGWIGAEAFLGIAADASGYGLTGAMGDTVPAGTCLFDEQGHPIGRVKEPTVPGLDDAGRFTQPTAWGQLRLHVEPAPGGWTTCAR